MRRKWNLFRNTNLSELCDFWETTHRVFLKESEAYSNDIFGISYEQLVSDTENTVKRVADFCDLIPRKSLKKLKDIPNYQTKGLRNVVQGVIQISEQSATSEFVLNKRECEFVNSRLGPVYQYLNNYFEKTNNLIPGPTTHPES